MAARRGRQRSGLAGPALRTPRATAKRRLWLGRTLRHLRASEGAWLAGDINGAHAGVLAGAHRPATAAALAEHEDQLLGWAKTLSHPHFCRAVRYWTQVADPAGAERGDQDKVEGRSLHLSRTYADCWVGDLVLDPVSGAIVAGELGRLEQALFETDWAEARQRLGQEPMVGDLGRTPAQRRADALVEMATRSATAPAGGRRPQPLFSVLVGWETLHGRICELADGTVVSPATVVGWLDGARLERIVFDARSRVIDVGVAQRLFSGATRRAVELRDRECFHDLCDERYERCQVDHIQPWAAGGATVADNGRVACGFHNRARHRPRGPDP